MTHVKSEQDGGKTPAWWMVLAPFLVMAVIFGFSSRSQLPDLDGGRDLQNVIGHFAVYAALGASLALLFRAIGWGVLRSLLCAVVLATLYGVSDEFHQSFVPNRNVDPRDVLVDFLGATGGALAMLRLLDYRATYRHARDEAPIEDDEGPKPGR